jgi:hypothetical protein
MLRDRIGFAELKVLKFLTNKSPKDEYQETVSRVKSKRDPPTHAQKNIQRKRKSELLLKAFKESQASQNYVLGKGLPKTFIIDGVKISWNPGKKDLMVVQIFLLHD